MRPSEILSGGFLARSPVDTSNTNDMRSIFWDHLLKDHAPETLDFLPSPTLADILDEAWGFFQNATSDHGDIFHALLTEDTHASLAPQTPQGSYSARGEWTLFLLRNDNKRFLVEALQHVLSLEGLVPCFLAHPIYGVERGDDGVLTHLSPATRQGSVRPEASLILILLPDHLEKTRLEDLTHKFSKSLRLVTHMVGDWGAMREHAKTIGALLLSSPQHQEISQFFEWLAGDHFTFLGYARDPNVGGSPWIQGSEHEGCLGILRDSPEAWEAEFVMGDKSTSQPSLTQIPELIISKTTQVSPILRSELMDVICIHLGSREAADGTVDPGATHFFFGFFNARAFNQSARDLPVVRLKIDAIMEKAGVCPTWHDGRRLIQILEAIPRDELFQSSVDDLWKLAHLGLGFHGGERVRVFVRWDFLGRYASCFIYVPWSAYRGGTEESVSQEVGNFLKGEVLTHQARVEGFPFAWIHCVVRLHQPFVQPHSCLLNLEQLLTHSLLTWDTHLKRAWEKRLGSKQGRIFYTQSRNAFPKTYQDYFTAEEAVEDFLRLEVHLTRGKVGLFLESSASQPSLVSLKIYSPVHPIPLSEIIPHLEHFGFHVLTEVPFHIAPWHHEGVRGWIYLISAQPRQGTVDITNGPLIVDAFEKVWAGETESDGFHRLILGAGLNWHQCVILRAYHKYLKQLQRPYSQQSVEEVLMRHGLLTGKLLDLFQVRFDPHRDGDRGPDADALSADLNTAISLLTHPYDEGVFQAFLELVQGTLRTTFYQQTPEGAPKPYVAFKFSPQHFTEVPLPIPLYEIFVYSSRMEGLHLRGGHLARGGIRWSSRPEDYRTEVLSLMKTQMIKNALIVPVGSKGAFVVKAPPLEGAQLRQESVACYRFFISGLLDLTDNFLEGKPVTPVNVVSWDEPDPYLVVAADKGTADFSDDANALAARYHFWLGDGFASGGVYGYNHKEMAITSRGAWKSLEHHFAALGKDPNRDAFTVIGVGDMSGDVFGNGMLLSRTLQLQAAFDHRHIFLDPSPDPESSYAERKRLFDRPASSWADYDPALLSTGGGIFSRNARLIPLSDEVKAFLNVQQDALSPHILIQSLLKAPVDVLWLGGVGTFVKGPDEAHSQVGDKVNDGVRVDGDAVGARVVVEGANLGFTQRGRIAYALAGGRMNTDALDNSAGVDCSDHEVNLKLLFSGPIARQEMTVVQRNTLLEQMKQDVAQLVLDDNEGQNRVVGFAYAKGPGLLDEQISFLHFLETTGILNRHLEELPSDETLHQRKALGQGFVRPELCVLLAYSKIVLKKHSAHAPLLSDPLIEKLFLDYFPPLIREKFESLCAAHPLKQEILATQVTNVLVHGRGLSFVHAICDITGAPWDQIVKMTWVVQELLCLKDLEQASLACTNIPLREEAFWIVDGVVKRLVVWFLAQNYGNDPLETIIQRYQDGFEELRIRGDAAGVSPDGGRVDKKVEKFFSNEGDPHDQQLGTLLRTLMSLSVAPDIVQASLALKRPVAQVAALYEALGEKLGIGWLRDVMETLPTPTPFQVRAARGIREQILSIQHQLTRAVFQAEGSTGGEDGVKMLAAWWHRHVDALSHYDRVLEEIQKSPLVDLAPLVVMERELERVYEKTAGTCLMTAL